METPGVITQKVSPCTAAEGEEKARGYRWFGGGDGQPKAWWTKVDEDDLVAKLRFLEREVYLREVELRRDVLTAYERHRPA